IDVMGRLAIEDPNLVTSINKETGEYLLSGMGELHLEIAVKFLKEYAGGEFEIITSKPLVVYRESTMSQGVVAMAKSPNKHSKFWIQVEPLEENIIQMIEKGDLAEEMGRKKMGTVLKEAGWPTKQARNIWSLEEHRNILVDMTKGVQYLREVRDMVMAGFRWACESGPLSEEPMRGLKVTLTDASLHEDPVHRGPAQIMPAIRRGILGSFLSSNPIILEPVYKIGVSVSTQWVGEVSGLITRKRGRVISSEQKGPLTVITGYIPVAETFGLSADMRSATSGHAFWQTAFDHWEKAPEGVAAEVITATRERKGLSPDIPGAGRFIDTA
ncbi:elongation factor EF-2, partial [Candidatus Bathyarchaeota archaeon]|nr:elongation factor EF-2 [Candidatus Bathyarchaeota archaeon]